MSKNIQRAVKQNQKHVLARLREVIGGSQKSASDDLGIATDTCASIESGRANLTPAVARRVASWTGVSEQCLLRGDAKLTTEKGKPYTRDVFDRIQADKKQDVLVWSNPANSDFYRTQCLNQFRHLATMLAGLMLAAHTTRKVGFIDAKLTSEMERLAKLLRQDGVTAEFGRRVWEQTENLTAESEAGLIAVFNLLKKELPPARSLDEYLKWPALTPKQIKTARKRSRSR